MYPERIPRGITTSVNDKQEFDAKTLSHLEGFDLTEAIKDKWVMEDFERVLSQRQKHIMDLARKTKTKAREIPQLERYILLAEIKRMRDTYRKRVEEIGKKYGDSHKTIR